MLIDMAGKHQPCHTASRAVDFAAALHDEKRFGHEHPTILVVDDDSAQRLMVRESLEQVGFTIVEARDGAEALSVAERARPDLVLLDVMMPVLDGFATCARLRCHEQFMHLPIVMVTGLEDIGSIEKAYEAGATSFLTKPINWALLDYHIKYVLRANLIEQEMREAKSRAEEAAEAAQAGNRAKSEFLAVVSHELRTPLTSIFGSLRLLRGGAAGDIPDCAKKMIDIACRNSDRLILLINDILDIEKIESGHMELKPERLEITDLVRSAIDANRGFAETRGLTLQLVEALAGVRIEGDGNRLMQVLTNLLSNAIKFSPHDQKVEIAVRRRGSAVRVSVRDHGPGIAEEFHGAVFDKFTQFDSSDSRGNGGSGLGLSICKAIVELHGGKIGFDSEMGKGTTFYFDLPITAPPRVVPCSAADLADGPFPGTSH